MSKPFHNHFCSLVIKDDQGGSPLQVVDPVYRAVVDPQLRHARRNGLDGTKIATDEALDPGQNLRPGLSDHGDRQAIGRTALSGRFQSAINCSLLATTPQRCLAGSHQARHILRTPQIRSGKRFQHRTWLQLPSSVSGCWATTSSWFSKNVLLFYCGMLYSSLPR